MFNKALKTQYEDLSLGEDVASCIASAASNDELVLRVIAEIAKRDRVLLNFQKEGNIDKDRIYGVTKDEIRKSISFGEKKVTSGGKKGEIVTAHPAIKKIDSIIAFLMGATIVYYEKHASKHKRYLFTSRAIEVILILQKRGYLSIEEILKEAKEN